MSERKLEPGAYAKITNPEYLAWADDANLIASTNSTDDHYLHDCYLHGEFGAGWIRAWGLTPCPPPPDSPLGRAEAEIEFLHGRIAEVAGMALQACESDNPDDIKDIVKEILVHCNMTHWRAADTD